jgi:hypothetical protein
MKEATRSCWAAIALTVYFRVSIVSRGQGVIEAKINLVLSQGNFMMPHFHLEAIVSRASINSVRTRTASSLAEVEVTADIMRHWAYRRPAIGLNRKNSGSGPAL